MANTVIKVKRTSVSGRVANTTDVANSAYIGAGEFALNMTDGILFSSNGSSLIEIGANNTNQHITNTITVGSNLVINTSTFYVGNSVVNSSITSTQITNDIGQFSVALYVGDNVDLTTTGLYIGNSSSNSVLNSSSLKLANTSSNITITIPPTSSENYFLAANGTWSQPATGTALAAGSNTHIQFNDSGALGTDALFTYQKDIDTLFLGSNVTVNTSAFFVGNDVVNSTITAAQITNDVGQFNVGLYVGSNVDILTNGFYVGNSITNSAITSSASYFTGNVAIGDTDTSKYTLCVNGSFAATTKSFLIPHPTKPKMMLRYGSLEGPENGVYVRGRITSNRIDLPDYWKGLVDEDTLTVNLTPIGNTKMPSIEEIKNNKVYLKNGFMRRIDCYFIIFGERKDVPRLEVEF